MNREEYMLDYHNKLLLDHYPKIKFETSTCINPGDTDTIISKNEAKKIGVLTRHLFDASGGITHAVFFENKFYERINE